MPFQNSSGIVRRYSGSAFERHPSTTALVPCRRWSRCVSASSRQIAKPVALIAASFAVAVVTFKSLSNVANGLNVSVAVLLNQRVIRQPVGADARVAKQCPIPRSCLVGTQRRFHERRDVGRCDVALILGRNDRRDVQQPRAGLAVVVTSPGFVELTVVSTVDVDTRFEVEVVAAKSQTVVLTKAVEGGFVRVVAALQRQEVYVLGCWTRRS